jgi:hypothetical protein
MLFTAVIAAIEFHTTKNEWLPDSEIYLWMTLCDLGIPSDVALEETRSFMLVQLSDLERNPQRDSYANLYSSDAPQYWDDQFALFRNRPMYPYLSSLLYPWLGPFALKAISLATYMLTVVVIFSLLLTMCQPVRAGIGALVFAIQDLVLHTATLALTDQCAMLFWACALSAIMCYTKSRKRAWLLAIVASSVALTLTRPAFFLPIGAAVGAFLALKNSNGTRTALLPLCAAIPAAVVYFVLGAIIHGPSVMTQIHWQYNSQLILHGSGTGHGLVVWYCLALLKGLANIVTTLARDVGGLTLVILAILGGLLYRGTAAVKIAIGSILSTSVALFVNPIDVGRPLLLPLTPFTVVLALLVFQRVDLKSKPADD